MNKKELVLNFLKKHNLKIFVVFTIIILFESTIIFSIHFKQFEFILKSIFFNRYNEFQWVFFTSIVAIISIAVSIKNQNASIRANIVSKERSRWLTENKKQLAIFLGEIETVRFNSNGALSIKRNPTNHKDIEHKQALYDNKIESFYDSFEKIRSAKRFISLDLSSNNENDIFIKLMDEVYINIEAYRKGNYYLESISGKFSREEVIESEHSINLDRSLDDLVNYAKTYYKEVWETIKSGN
ncbi:hypothetical protein AB6831_04285 [Carnobacterium divergens]|uniref:hypothetical protein n=1 Tax=Carnobacterium divergens TaxID=2748 RepID=UPI0039C8D561